MSTSSSLASFHRSSHAYPLNPKLTVSVISVKAHPSAMFYYMPSVILTQCQFCPTIVRGKISPVHNCRYGYIPKSNGPSDPPDQSDGNPYALDPLSGAPCGGLFLPTPEDGGSLPTMMFTGHEICERCTGRLGVELMVPGGENEAEVEKLMVWSRWEVFVMNTALQDVLGNEPEFERRE
jgi:hypothetical protein